MVTDIELALAAAAAGVAVVRESYGAELVHLDKTPTDFATEVDLAAEQAIHAVIAAERPGDAFEGEEGGSSGAVDAARCWLVDPLCGTLNYAATTPLAAINVALATTAGITTVAVSADPIAAETFWTDGQRAWVRRGDIDTPLTPSSRSLLVDINCDAKSDAMFLGPQLVADSAFRAAFGPRVLSTTLAVAWVAAGRRAAYITDGWLDRSVHFAAGIALCRAAGCVVTDLAGGELHAGRGLVAAADAATHARLLGLIRPHLVALRSQRDQN